MPAWECPRCGRINAPWAHQCTCVPSRAPTTIPPTPLETFIPDGTIYGPAPVMSERRTVPPTPVSRKFPRPATVRPSDDEDLDTIIFDELPTSFPEDEVARRMRGLPSEPWCDTLPSTVLTPKR